MRSNRNKIKHTHTPILKMLNNLMTTLTINRLVIRNHKVLVNKATNPQHAQSLVNNIEIKPSSTYVGA